MNAPMTARTELVPLNDLQRMAEAIAKSGLFGMKTADQAMALMLTAQAEGQHPATITQDYDIIQGRAARKTHSVLARYQQAGGSVEWHCLTDTKADATFAPPPGAGKPLRIEWTIDMAKRCDLTGKDNWKKYPRAMLRARCIAEGVRATYPAAIGGMMVAEEAQDLTERDITAEGETLPKPTVEQPRSKSQRAEPAPQQSAPETAGADPAAEAVRREEEAQARTEAAQASGPVKPGMLGILRAKLKAAQSALGSKAPTEEIMCAHFGISKLEELPAAKINDAISYVTNPPGAH